MKLIRTELRRLRWRGINLVALLALLGVVLLMTFNSYQSSKPPSEQMLVEAEEELQWYLALWEENHERDYQECLTGEHEEQEAWIASGESGSLGSWGCEGLLEEPTANMFLPYWQESFTNYLDNTFGGLIIIVLAIALFLGASFNAGEINSGSMGTWLTFEPRRTQVYYSKSAALFIWGVVVGLATLSLGLLLAWLVYSLNGMGELTSKQWTDALLTVARCVPLFGIAAAVGGSLGIILRHTAAAAVVVFAWAAVVEPIIRYGSWRQLTPWLITPNVQGWIEAGTEYWYSSCSGGGVNYLCETVHLSHGGLRSFIYVMIAAALVSTIGNLIFRRRDIN